MKKKFFIFNTLLILLLTMAFALCLFGCDDIESPQPQSQNLPSEEDLVNPSTQDEEDSKEKTDKDGDTDKADVDKDSPTSSTDTTDQDKDIPQKDDGGETEQDEKDETEIVEKPSEIVLLDYNIRCKTNEAKTNRNWATRKKIIFKQIKDYDPDIIGLQEVRLVQLRDINKEFSNTYTLVGEPNNDTTSSERVLILVKKSRFEILDSGTFWLSETPEIMSKSWNSACYRICTFVKLRDKNTNKELSYYNTHLDHKSNNARINGANVIIERLLLEDNPYLLTGDMNARMSTTVYKNFTDVMDDTRYLVPSEVQEKKCITYNGYSNLSGGEPIDYCFAKKDAFDVLSFQVKNIMFDLKGNPLPDSTEEGDNACFASDHFPLLIRLKIK